MLARPLLTREVLTLVGISHDQLVGLLRRGKVPTPTKDASGRLTWLPADITRLRAVLDERGKRQSVISSPSTSPIES